MGGNGRRGARRGWLAFALGCCLIPACSGSGSSESSGDGGTGPPSGGSGGGSGGQGPTGGSGGSLVTSERIQLGIPMLSEMGPQGLMLQAGQALRMTTPIEVPDLGIKIAEATLDMEGTMTHVGFEPSDPSAEPVGESELKASAWVATIDALDPCESGDPYGPVSAPILGGALTGAVAPTVLNMTPSTLSKLNEGTASLCFELLSPLDAFVTLDGIELSLVLGLECNKPPENLVGEWEGTYSCDNSCDDEGGAVWLEITQNGHQASYTDDFGSSYQGAVCGWEFAFVGGGQEGLQSYVEAGRFVASPDGKTATKDSMWTGGMCWGTCHDTLSKK